VKSGGDLRWLTLQRAKFDSMADDFEDKEDPLKDPKPLKIIEDEEDESGGGVDYRRMYKGYLSSLP